MRTLLRLGLVIAWLFAALLPASGASVIFYSKADNSYGWCAGYSYSRGESCARETCLDYGSRCELAIECDGGWSATAFAPDPFSGFGASCEWQSAASARGVALLSCIYASHALCSTSAAFDGDGSTTSENSNSSFDLAWYTQSLLQALGYDIGDIDGEIGSRTRAAIEHFQSAVGLEATGKADWGLMGLMLYAHGGTARFVRDIIAQTDTADQHTVQTYAYRYAAVPAADLTLAGELAGLVEEARLMAVAALLAYADAPCALPASSVGATDTDGTWAVACAEGEYLLALGGPTPLVTRADGTVTIKPIPAACPPGDEPLPTPDPSAQQQVKPSPNTLNGPGEDTGPSSDLKRSLLTTNDPGPQAAASSPTDCLMTEVMRLKPSPNTVNGMSPELGALIADPE